MKPPPEASPDDAARWDELTAEFLALPDVTLGRAFSRISLKVHGKLFASAGGDGLLIKIGEPRVAELVAAGLATPFSPSPGRTMREWTIALPASDWRALATESLAFVRAAEGLSAVEIRRRRRTSR